MKFKRNVNTDFRIADCCAFDPMAKLIQRCTTDPSRTAWSYWPIQEDRMLCQ